MEIKARLLCLALPMMFAGCRALGDTGDSSFGDECASDTAIYGCVDITGRVSTPADFPLEDVDVGPAPGSDTHGLEAKFVNTGADGGYELRLVQLDATAPFSFDLTLKATQRNNAGGEVKSKTVTVPVTVYPLDDFPDPVVVNFVIQ
jgi:hypothetical protein